MDNNSSPWVEIVRQPAGRQRFHRGNDITLMCSMCGYNRPRYRKKSFSPQIKIHGDVGDFVVVVSCITENEPFRPHPNSLIGRECKKGVCTVRCLNYDSTCVFPHLTIHKARSEDIETRLKQRKAINVDPYQTGFNNEEGEIDLTAVRLCFQVFLPDKNGMITRSGVRVLPPVVSLPIYDEKHGDRTRGSSIKKHLYQQVEEQSELCDVSIQVGTWVRKYHWNVLCLIPFFARLYDSKLKERQTGIINLSIGSSCSVQSAVDFLYGHEPVIDLNTAYNLLETADFLMIDELMRLCEKKIKSFTVTSQSCLTLLFISSRFDIPIPNLENFYLSHLPELMKQTQMLEIDKDAVRLLLTDQTLSYIAKGDIIKFLLRWASFHPDRKSDFAEMLSYLEKDDFTAEIMTTVHGTYPDLEKLIDELHPSCHLTNGETKAMLSNNGYETIVIYPPDKKLSTLMFHGYSMKHKCWFKIPVESELTEQDRPIVAEGKDTIYTLDMCTETMSVFNIKSGQSYQKKLVFQEGAHILAFQVPMTVSEETIFIAKNFHDIVLNTDDGNVSHYDGPPDLIRFETKSMVYASVDIENTEINMDSLFSVDIQIDKMCVAGNLLCLLSHTSHQLIVYCLKKKLRAAIKLPPCSLPDKDGIFTSSGNHVYILADGFIVDIEFQTLPKKILWKVQTIFPNELFFSSAVSFHQIMQDKMIGQTKDDKTQARTLKWQKIGSENVPATNEEPLYDIDIPEKIPYSDKHRLMHLKLPKETLKCHIDCPHCKDKDAEQLDLFSYQQSFSSGEESAEDEQEDWSDEDPFDDPDSRHLYDSDDSDATI